MYKPCCNLCSALLVRVKKIFLNLEFTFLSKFKCRMVSRNSVSSPQMSLPRYVQGSHIFCTSHSGGKKQLTQVGLFEKGSVKGLFTEMQVGSVKATQGPSLSK